MTETQTKTKHNDGPWRVTSSGEYWEIVDKWDKVITRIRKVSDSYHEEQVIESNARVLAAAPDLLEALKEMLRHTDGNCAELPTTTFSKAERNARAAIGKATL